MKKILKHYPIYSLFTSIIIYLGVSFIRWDILFIKNISTWNMSDRGGVIMIYILKEFIALIVYEIMKDNGYFKNETK